jgi:COP9 signalosome complex subunit 2
MNSDDDDDDDNESYHYSDDEDMNSENYGDEDGGGEDDDGQLLKQSSDFEFSSDGNEDADDLEVAIENAYYNAKQLRDTSIPAALEAFEEVVQLESQQQQQQSYPNTSSRKDQPTTTTASSTTCRCGPWSYKAIKQLVKLHLLRTNNTKEMLRHYDRLLQCIISGAVTQNVYEKSISGLLDRVSQTVATATANSTSTATSIDLLTLKQMYVSTLNVVQPSVGLCPNERLWFKTSLKLGQLLYELNDIPQLQILIKELLKTQQQQPTPAATAATAAASFDSATAGTTSTLTTDYSSFSSTTTSRFAGTHLLEIYALQIQLYSRKKDNKKLRELFDRAMRVVEGGIPHPRTLALIQEMGGKMHMASKEFEAAGKTFFQAFKSYDEAGDPNRLRCLKYLVMATMLHASTINPFDSQEARPYKDDPEIVAMTNLVHAFHNNKIRDFENILRKNEGRIMDDEFIREHLEDLLRTIRTQVIQNVIRPCKYTTLCKTNYV